MNEVQLLLLPKVSDSRWLDQVGSKISDTLKKLTVLISETYTDFANSTSATFNNVSTNSTAPFRRMKKYFKRKLVLPGLILMFFAIIAILIIGNTVNNTSLYSSTNVLGNTDQRIEITKPKAEQAINRMFLFSLKDASGIEVSKIKFFIENVQLQDQIVIKGQKATAVQNRTFLILNLKITNDYNKSVTISSRDYIRLMTNNNKEWLAPDIHNDPVDIQAISTKYTRLGFPLSDSDRNLLLQVGEIAGKKETISLTLQ
jgi:hypothetical protein